MVDFGFNKRLRMCLDKDIELLFTSGSYTRQGFLASKHLYRDQLPGEAPLMVLMVVPKRRVAKAVHRNRIKRLMRESYRKARPAAQAELAMQGQTLLLALLFEGKQLPSQHEVQQNLQKLLLKLGHKRVPNQ